MSSNDAVWTAALGSQRNPMPKTLAQMATEIEAVNREKGWYDDERSFGDLVALLHSEVSEILEAYRDRGTEAWYGPNDKPEGVGAEMADVLIRLLDFASRYDVNLGAEYEIKLAYNKSRSYRHGGKRL